MTRWIHPAQDISLHHGDSLKSYASWESPTLIISDGPYGVNGYPGDPSSPAELPAMYEPHIEAWAQAATPQTSLWFWNTEVGWAMTHPVLEKHGWRYQQLVVWDKGIAHVAGNVNSDTIRQCPVVTEVAALYRRDVTLPDPTGRPLSLQEWIRSEWKRSRLPLKTANTACGVKNAASRKYLTADHLFYLPPAEMMVRLARYANEHGKASGRPYFPLPFEPSVADADGRFLGMSERWIDQRDMLVGKWNHEHGVTNVWPHPAVRGAERIKSPGGRVVHPNQKPLALIERQVRMTTDSGDLIWEPFAGLATGGVAAGRIGRRYVGGELVLDTYLAAKRRLEGELG